MADFADAPSKRQNERQEVHPALAKLVPVKNHEKETLMNGQRICSFKK
jgi:hypothetical protein